MQRKEDKQPAIMRMLGAKGGMIDLYIFLGVWAIVGLMFLFAKLTQ